MSERFNVVQIFPDGTNEYVARAVDLEKAMDVAIDYTRRPAAQIGIINQVMVTDMMDLLCFHWKFGEGVVFPTKEQIEESRKANEEEEK